MQLEKQHLKYESKGNKRSKWYIANHWDSTETATEKIRCKL